MTIVLKSVVDASPRDAVIGDIQSLIDKAAASPDDVDSGTPANEIWDLAKARFAFGFRTLQDRMKEDVAARVEACEKRRQERRA